MGGDPAVTDIVGVFFILFLYFLPTLISWQQRCKHSDGIFVLNLFLGWTLIGWVVALIWAVSDSRAPRRGAGSGGLRVMGNAEPDAWKRAKVAGPAVVRPDGNEFVVEGEGGILGRIGGSDAHRLAFRIEAEGKPRVVIENLRQPLTLWVTFPAAP